MNVALVCVGSFQDGVLATLRQLLRLGHKLVYVITEPVFYDDFEAVRDRPEVRLVATASLPEDDNGGGRAGGGPRFRYLHKLMLHIGLEDVVYLDNGVAVHHHVDVLAGCVDRSKIYVPFDSFAKPVTSIVYIPTADALRRVLVDGRLDFHHACREHPGLIEPFPVCKPLPGFSAEQLFVCRNYGRFANFVFDAQAMGRCMEGLEAQGAVVDYQKLKGFVWIYVDNIPRPFLLVNASEALPIFNSRPACAATCGA